MELFDALPLRSCGVGGRKVVIIAKFALTRNLVPIFLLYDINGSRLHVHEKSLLCQPNPRQITVMRNAMSFIVPSQPFAEKIFINQWVVKLTIMRLSDGLLSNTMFLFDLVPHDFYSTCFFCEFDPDKQFRGRSDHNSFNISCTTNHVLDIGLDPSTSITTPLLEDCSDVACLDSTFAVSTPDVEELNTTDTFGTNYFTNDSIPGVPRIMAVKTYVESHQERSMVEKACPSFDLSYDPALKLEDESCIADGLDSISVLPEMPYEDIGNMDVIVSSINKNCVLSNCGFWQVKTGDGILGVSSVFRDVEIGHKSYFLRALLARTHDEYRHVGITSPCASHFNTLVNNRFHVLQIHDHFKGTHYFRDHLHRPSILIPINSPKNGTINTDYIPFRVVCHSSCSTSVDRSFKNTDKSHIISLMLTLEVQSSINQCGLDVIGRRSVKIWSKKVINPRDLSRAIRLEAKGGQALKLKRDRNPKLFAREMFHKANMNDIPLAGVVDELNILIERKDQQAGNKTRLSLRDQQKQSLAPIE